MMRSFSFMMLSFKSLPDKYSRKHRKDERLQKSHQHFNKINKYRKRNRNQGTTPTCSRMHLRKNEYQ